MEETRLKILPFYFSHVSWFTAIDFRLSCSTKRLGEEDINYVLYDNKELANKNPVIIIDCGTFMEILKRT